MEIITLKTPFGHIPVQGAPWQWFKSWSLEQPSSPLALGQLQHEGAELEKPIWFQEAGPFLSTVCATSLRTQWHALNLWCSPLVPYAPHCTAAKWWHHWSLWGIVWPSGSSTDFQGRGGGIGQTEHVAKGDNEVFGKKQREKEVMCKKNTLG
jgi:hypothetical protein